MKKIVTLAAGTLLFASPAFAQMADSDAGTDAPTADASAASFTDAEIDTYAKVAVEISALQNDASLDAEARQSGAVAAVESSGLTAEKFNEISDASRNDPELAQRIQLAIANAQGGA